MFWRIIVSVSRIETSSLRILGLFLPNARGLRTSFFPSEKLCQPTVPLRLNRLHLFELSIGLDQLCLTLRKLRFRLLKSRLGLCQCHLEVSRIWLGNSLKRLQTGRVLCASS